MFNSLITIFLFLVLSINALFASEKDYGNLTEITLKKGLNEKQAREVAIGLEEELTELFNYWLTESHFVFGKESHLNFNVDFSAASVDLDNDNVDDLLVRVEHENVCGIGDCLVVDILLGGDIVGIKAGSFGPRKIYVSDKTKHGLKYIYYEAVCTPKFKPEVCNFYMLEPKSSEKYSQAILVEKGREVE